MSQLYLETMAVFSYNADITCLKKIEQTGCKGDGLMYDMTPYLKKIDEIHRLKGKACYVDWSNKITIILSYLCFLCQKYKEI